MKLYVLIILIILSLSGFAMLVAASPPLVVTPTPASHPASATPAIIPVAVPLYGVGHSPTKASGPSTTDLNEVLEEIRALREEVKALRESLTPVGALPVKGTPVGQGFYLARCATCHSSKEAPEKGGDFALFDEAEKPIPTTYKRALARLNAGTMPPKKDADGAPVEALPANEKKPLVRFLESGLAAK